MTWPTLNRRLAGILASACLVSGALAQTTYYVNGSCGSDAWTGTNSVCVAPDGPKRTIQAGIDTSATGDTVIVADGTYTGAGNRDLDFAGRDIHLRSESLDPSLCIIDCQGSAVDPHRGFHFHSGETNDAVLEGFTITNGFVTSASPGGDIGGGMLNENSSPTVSNCTFDSNIAQLRGGGMYNDVSSPRVTNCTFSANTASGGSGGGMLNRNGSSPTVTDCTFSGNTAAGPLGAGAGGGMLNALGSNPSVTGCTFIGNMSPADAGGGMANVSGSSPIVRNCMFNNNTAPFGGGMFNIRTGSNPTITACTFRANTAGINGGGMSNGDSSSPTVTDCTFDSNIARQNGGGMYSSSSSPTVS
ncbi:MAG: right-handed parallel beta-helix repeat-containing protein, partial [Planctomycetes bacterium]|nr:right-handed parallel beta-helix repeat-containing protein [Planctomycetota bacterium]